jgi:hypothetical protein
MILIDILWGKGGVGGVMDSKGVGVSRLARA